MLWIAEKFDITSAAPLEFIYVDWIRYLLT